MFPPTTIAPEIFEGGVTMCPARQDQTLLPQSPAALQTFRKANASRAAQIAYCAEEGPLHN
jgi:hypothetical protein